MSEQICRECGKRIYWVDDLGLWYHWRQLDMLTCAAVKIMPKEDTDA